MLTAGEYLKREREKQSISLKQIEKKLKVREKFLKAIEENNWDAFSSKIYISGIIKNYADVVGANPSKALAFFRRDCEQQEEVTFKKRVSSRHLVPETRKYATVGLVIIIIAFFSYFVYQLKLYFSPPKVQLLAPKTNTFKRVDKITIIGKTEREAAIQIFDERIFQNKDGVFTYELPAQIGKNQLVIEVTGANGKKTILRREYLVSP